MTPRLSVDVHCPSVLLYLPIFWMISSSLRTTADLYETPQTLLPEVFTLVQYVDVILDSPLPDYYLNSIVYTVLVIIVTVVLSTLGGYGVTRLNIPRKKNFARTILFGHMFPPLLLSIPMFIFWKELGIINSILGLTLALTAKALPFGLWLMWQFFQTVPYSLEESAHMSGASRFRAFYEIALPMAKPGVIAVAVFAYATAWDAYTIPLIIVPDAAMWPITVGLDEFTRQRNVLWGQVMAANSLAILPGFLFVYYLQRYLLRGFSTDV